MIKISVLMSNYNTPVNYLKKSIDSILSQTFKNFELIIVNDGSVDESKDIIYEYAKRDSRIVILENEKNIGLPGSLNRGLDVCKGEYIARMDTDDICYPDRLEKQIKFMDENPNLILSGAWADIFSKDENEPYDTWKPVMCSQDEYHIRLLFSGEPLLIHPTVIFRREFLNKHNLRYSTELRFRYAEDYKMWVDCSAFGDIGILQYVVLRYRNENSKHRITTSKEKEMKKCCQNIQEEQLKKINVKLTNDKFQYHYRLLGGRKPYDITYKKWINSLINHNKKYKVYSQEVLKKLLHNRWYTITYYGIAYEKSVLKRIKYFTALFSDGKIKFIKSLFFKNTNRK